MTGEQRTHSYRGHAIRLEGDPASMPRVAPERDALLRVAAAAAGTNDLQSVLELAAEEALGAIGADSLTISRFEDDHKRYRTLINVGHLGPGEVRFPEEEVYEVEVFPRLMQMSMTAQPYFNSIDDPGCEPAAAAMLRELGKSSDLGVAIVVEGEIWGGLWTATIGPSATFQSEDVRFLEAVGGQLGAAIARAELFSKVSRLAYEDSLTGLANRRAFDERLERAIGRFAAGETALALLLCDVDGLKEINDRSGHAYGDDALQTVAGALVAAAADHPGAFVARMGGDEFCVLVESREHVPDGEELSAVERLGSTAQHLLRTGVPGLTVSCGIATANPRMANAATLLRAADTAQYVAKRRGGNRVCTAAQIADDPDLFPLTPADRTGTDAERIAAASETLARALTGELSGARLLDRLEFVATTLTETGNFSRWAISRAASGEDVLRELSVGDNRARPGAGVRIARADDAGEVFPLSDYPVTAAIVAAGTGTFVARVGDTDADEYERALLEREGFEGAVGAVCGQGDGVYLVEIVSDTAGSPLELVRPALALAVQAAAPQQPHRRLDSGVGSRDRALELSLALADRLAGATSAGAVCDGAVAEVQEAFGCAVVHLVEVVGDRLVLRSDRGPKGNAPEWHQDAGVGLIGRALREGEPVIADDVSREPQYRGTEATRGIGSELVVPIAVAGETWGVINLEDVRLAAFSTEDARLLESVAAQISGALRAVDLYERLDRAYIGTAEALSAALEAKDPYTAQHSRSIAEHVEAVGRQLGIDGEELRMLRYAAAFHDIGKLAIPREVLNKPEPLSQEEWLEMAQHTAVGERILAPIEFLAPIRPIVRSAHERWDGRGYPDGLAGEQIPLAARILFVCDSYDAMTTDRAYRVGMGEAEAREELRRAASSQFDPRVVEALLAVLGDGGGGGLGIDVRTGGGPVGRTTRAIAR